MAIPDLDYDVWERICLCLVRTPRHIRAPATWILDGDDPVDFDDDVATYEPLTNLSMVGREFSKVVRRFTFESIRCNESRNVHRILEHLHHPSLRYVLEKPLFGRSLDLALGSPGYTAALSDLIGLCHAMKTLTLQSGRMDLDDQSSAHLPVSFPVQLVDDVKACTSLVKLDLNSTTHAPTIHQLLLISNHLPNLTYLAIATLSPDQSPKLRQYLTDNGHLVRFPQVTHLSLGLDVTKRSQSGGSLYKSAKFLQLLRRPKHLPRLRFLDIRKNVGGWYTFLENKGYQLEHLGIESSSNLREAVFIQRHAPFITRLNVTTHDSFDREYLFEHDNIREIIIENSEGRRTEDGNRSLLKFVEWALCVHVPHLRLIVVRSNILPHHRIRSSFERTVAAKRSDAFLWAWNSPSVPPMPEIRWEGTRSVILHRCDADYLPI